MRRCRICGQDKAPGDFAVDKSKRDGLRRECKPCNNRLRVERDRRDPRSKARKAEWAKRQGPGFRKGKHVQARHRRVYGMVPGQYDSMLASQGGLCAICSCVLRSHKEPSHVDHDHATGRIRGVLCGHCNRGLGQFRDNVELLARAANYITLHSVKSALDQQEPTP